MQTADSKTKMVEERANAITAALNSLVAQYGLTSLEARHFFSDKQRLEDPTAQRYVETAIFAYSVDGEIEVDTDALVSRGEDPGCYVQAWIWVSDNDAGVERDDHGTLIPGPVLGAPPHRNLTPARRKVKYYRGSACSTCGGTLRYCSNWACVQCNRMKTVKREDLTLSEEDMKLLAQLRTSYRLSHKVLAEKFDITIRSLRKHLSWMKQNAMDE